MPEERVLWWCWYDRLVVGEGGGGTYSVTVTVTAAEQVSSPYWAATAAMRVAAMRENFIFACLLAVVAGD